MADSKERYRPHLAAVPVEAESESVLGRKVRSAVHAEESGAYESVANGSLAHSWVDLRGGNGLDVTGPQFSQCGAYESVANGSLAHSWVDLRGGNGLDVTGPQFSQSNC